MPDPSMSQAHFIGRQLSGMVDTPACLGDVGDRARLVNEINPPIRRDAFGRLQEISPIVAEHLHDVPDAVERLGIALRLWAGCMSAAKTIALETMDGPNSPEDRAQAFAGIDAIARTDAVFAAGVESAPRFKALHEQHYSFDGVPTDSVVRRFPNEFLLSRDG